MLKLNKYIALFLVVFFPYSAWAACTADVADTCSYADVAECVTEADDGDTITVPAGECTWTSQTLTLPSDKTLYLEGAGSSTAGTVITLSGSAHIVSTAPSNVISGFRFLHATGSSEEAIGIKNLGWRIHHNYFGHVTPGTNTRGYTSAIIPTGSGDGEVGVHPYGLIDHNTFADHRIVVYGDYGLEGQSTIWSQANDFGGSDDAVFVEDNDFVNRLSGNLMDGNNGAKFVFRFNTSDGTNIMMHSLQGADERGGKSWEIYRNDINLITGWYPLGFIRGGTGFFFDNTVTYDSQYYSDNAMIYLDNVRSGDTRDSCCGSGEPDADACDGTSDWDGNTADQYGYACRDQIGRGADSALFNTTTYAASTLEPAYFFNNYNSTGLSYILVSVRSTGYHSYHIQADRDFYDHNASFDGSSGVGRGTKSTLTGAGYWTSCTDGVGFWVTDEGSWNSNGEDGQLYVCDTNAWAVAFTPATYPHALQTDDSTAPTILSVTSDTVAGTYGLNDVIDIIVTCSEPVTGTMEVTLETGDNDREVSVVFSGQTSSSGNYTVQSGDASADLTHNSIASTGGINDLAGTPNAMSNFTPGSTLAENEAIVIDTTTQTSGSVVISGSGTVSCSGTGSVTCPE